MVRYRSDPRVLGDLGSIRIGDIFPMHPRECADAASNSNVAAVVNFTTKVHI